MRDPGPGADALAWPERMTRALAWMKADWADAMDREGAARQAHRSRLLGDRRGPDSRCEACMPSQRRAA